LQRNLQQIAQAPAAASLPVVCRERIRARRRLPCRFRHEERNAELHEGEATQLRNPEKNAKPVSLGRHEHGCKICSHRLREEIERDFINWKSPTLITKEYGLKDRSSVYRHAHVLGLPRRFPVAGCVHNPVLVVVPKAYDLGKSRRAKFGRVRQHKMEVA